MSCFNPRLVTACVDPADGALVWKYHGKTSVTASATRELNINNPLFVDAVNVPCKRCLGCRLDYARSWADRMLLEFCSNSCDRNAIFVTLTYNNFHLPFVDGIPSLRSRDLQLFMKRLRSHFSDRKLRYFISGEYGPRTLRPHYHGIIFGLSLDDLPLDLLGHNDLNQPLFISPLLENIWSNGFVSVGSASFDSMQYVSRYMLKKLFRSDRPVREFSRMSLKPAIGVPFFQSNKLDFSIDNVNINVYDGSVHKSIAIPSKFFEILPDPDGVLRSIQRRRRDLAEDKLLLQLSNTDLGFSSYLDNMQASLLNKRSVIMQRNKF